MKSLLALMGALLLCVGNTQAQKKKKDTAVSTASTLEQGTVGTDGKRVGKWNFYNPHQELELTFDYDSSRISFLAPDTTRYLVQAEGVWQPKRLNRAPHLLGSMQQRLETIGKSLRYPVSALQEQLQGTVVIGYTVGADGHTQDYAVESSLSTDCDRAVWEVLKAAPDNWIPAVYRGRPTATRFYMAVHFSIQDEASLRRAKTVQDGLTSILMGSAPAATPAKPRYAHEVFVTALAVERGVRTEYNGRQPR